MAKRCVHERVRIIANCPYRFGLGRQMPHQRDFAGQLLVIVVFQLTCQRIVEIAADQRKREQGRQRKQQREAHGQRARRP